jgi:hypothetical protein
MDFTKMVGLAFTPNNGIGMGKRGDGDLMKQRRSSNSHRVNCVMHLKLSLLHKIAVIRFQIGISSFGSFLRANEVD